MPHLLVVAALVAVAIVAQRVFAGALRRHDDQTYRPRGRPRKAEQGAGTTVLISRAQLAGLRDALTAAPIDPQASLSRCDGCQSMYHDASLQALRHENHGRCVACHGLRFVPVRVVD